MKRTLLLKYAAGLLMLAFNGCNTAAVDDDEAVDQDSEPVSGTNLLSNAGFENGTAAPWQQWGSFGVVTGDAHAGTYSAAVGKANGGGQRVAVTSGRTYTYSAWGKVGGAGGNGLLVLKYFNANGAQVGGELTSGAFAATYSQQSIQSTVPSGATVAQIGFWNSNDGTLSLDDFVFKDDSDDDGGSGGGANLLVNGDWEGTGIEPWEPWGGFSLSSQQDARSGARAAMVPPQNGGGQFVAVTAGTTYTLRVWGKAGGTGWSGINFKFFDDNWQWVSTEQSSGPFSATYGERTISGVAPPGATRLQVGFYNSSSANLYLDDMSVVANDGAGGAGGSGGSGSCTQDQPSSGTLTSRVVGANAPVTVPSTFSGLTVRTHTRTGAAVPAPAASFSLARTMGAHGPGGDAGTEPFFWRNIETAPGQYDWSKADAYVAALPQTTNLVVTIYGTPQFYARYPNEANPWPSYPGAGSPPTAANMPKVGALVREYLARPWAGRIVAFEVWNEPLFRWDTPPTEYGDAGRVSPQWAAANNTPVFYSGSASELANIAYEVYQNRDGREVLLGAIENPTTGANNVLERILNAPVTVGGSGPAKNYATAISTHYYDFSNNMGELSSGIDKIRTVSSLPLWHTEGGGWDNTVPDNILAMGLVAASHGLKSEIPYVHTGPSDHEQVQHFGVPANDPGLVTRLNQLKDLEGQTICNAGIVNQSGVAKWWVKTSTGTEIFAAL